MTGLMIRTMNRTQGEAVRQPQAADVYRQVPVIAPASGGRHRWSSFRIVDPDTAEGCRAGRSVERRHAGYPG